MTETGKPGDPSKIRRTPPISSLGLDDVDIQILRTVQVDGRKKRNELADEVHLSHPAITERLRKLEDRKVLEGFYAKLQPKLLGLDVAAFILVSVERTPGDASTNHYAGFLQAAQEHPEVLEVHATTGEGSHLLKIRTWNTSTLEQLLSQIQLWPGVKSTRTSVVLSTHKETLELPLSELKTSTGLD